MPSPSQPAIEIKPPAEQGEPYLLTPESVANAKNFLLDQIDSSAIVEGLPEDMSTLELAVAAEGIAGQIGCELAAGSIVRTYERQRGNF